MKVAVLGGSGFLGSRFVGLYKKKFDDTLSLNSKNSPLKNYDKLLENTKGVDCLVNSAFDHNYKNNIDGIKNVLKVCKNNSIKKLVYISTVSVYDPDIEGILSENSKYSNINDPYSKEKRKIELELEKYKNCNFDIIILQPNIVYGLGGSWTKYALHVCKSKAISLPNNGNDICNAVYVDDVVNAIYQSCISKIKYEKILISSKESITWNEFYKKQCGILTDLSFSSNCNIEDNKNRNEFHSKSIINFIFTLWFKTSFGNIFDLMIATLKKLREKSYKNTSSDASLKEFLKSGIGEDILTPLGITKKVHSCKFNVDISKANNLLNYKPDFSFDDGIKQIKEDIEKIVKS